jgi:hypothetical protein
LKIAGRVHWRGARMANGSISVGLPNSLGSL